MSVSKLTNNLLLGYLSQISAVIQYQNQFYGSSFFAVGLELLHGQNIITSKIYYHYMTQVKKNDTHSEFNSFAWSFSSFSTPKYSSKTPFFRKVTNWVLMRCILNIEERKAFSSITSPLLLFIITKSNKDGSILTDNSLRMIFTKFKNRSSQYHSFSTFLIFRYYQLTNQAYFKDLALNLHEQSMQAIQYNGFEIQSGRGHKQLFGYASNLLNCMHAYIFTGDGRYIRTYDRLVSLLSSYCNETPLRVPLSLGYKKDYTLSYNNLYDYSGFLFFALVYTTKLREKFLKQTKSSSVN